MALGPSLPVFSCLLSRPSSGPIRDVALPVPRDNSIALSEPMSDDAIPRTEAQQRTSNSSLVSSVLESSNNRTRFTLFVLPAGFWPSSAASAASGPRGDKGKMIEPSVGRASTETHSENNHLAESTTYRSRALNGALAMINSMLKPAR